MNKMFNKINKMNKIKLKVKFNKNNNYKLINKNKNNVKLSFNKLNNNFFKILKTVKKI